MERHSSKGWSSKQYPNVLTTGFTIGTTYHLAKNSYGFYVKDPRGYTIAISNDNLESIIQYSTIDRGVIIDSCIWTNNGILKTKSEYEADLEYVAKEVKPEYLKMAKVPIGSVVEDQHGRRYVWMGAYHTIVEQYGSFKWSSGKIQYSIDVRVPRSKRGDGRKISDSLTYGVLQSSVIKFVKICDDEPFDVPDPKDIINTMLYDDPKGRLKTTRKYVADNQFDFTYKFMPNVPTNCILNPENRPFHKYAVNLSTGDVHAIWIQPKTIYSSVKNKYARVVLTNTHTFRYQSEKEGYFSTMNSTVCDIVLWNNDTNEMLSFFKEESVEGN
jgi:hypothetical protein